MSKPKEKNFPVPVSRTPRTAGSVSRSPRQLDSSSTTCSFSALTLPRSSRIVAMPPWTVRWTNVIALLLPEDTCRSGRRGQVPGAFAEHPHRRFTRQYPPHEKGCEAVEAAGDHHARPAEPPERLLHHLGRLDHPRLALRGGPEESGRPRRARSAGEHVDAPAAQLEPEPLPKHKVERLGRAVGGDERAAVKRGEGRHEDQPSPPARGHPPSQHVGHRQRATAVHVHAAQLVLEGEVEELPARSVRRVEHPEAHLLRAGQTLELGPEPLAGEVEGPGL